MNKRIDLENEGLKNLKRINENELTKDERKQLFEKNSKKQLNREIEERNTELRKFNKIQLVVQEIPRR